LIAAQRSDGVFLLERDIRRRGAFSPHWHSNAFALRRGSYLRDRGVFLNRRSMDNLFLKRVNSWQGLVKKEQEPIFEKSIGSPHGLPFL